MELLWQQRRRNTLVSWPEDIDQRLDLLVRATAAAGENTSRSQLLAALVAAAEIDPQQLADTLRTYRRLDSDALIADNQRDDLPTTRRTGAPRTRP